MELIRVGKNIAFGKLGRSMKFNRDNWKDGAGNNEPAILLSTLANAFPNDNFYVVGKSDFARCSEKQLKYWFKHDNVFDVWENYDKNKHDKLTYPYSATKHLTFDFAIINGGITGTINTPNTFHKIDKRTGELSDEKLKTLAFTENYVAPILHFLNSTGIKWINIHADARQFPITAKDLFNQPTITLGTTQQSKNVKTYVSYTDETIIEQTQESIYGASELLCLLDKEYINEPMRKEEKEIKVGLFFHKYKDKKRINGLLEYIDLFDDISVFGNWKEELEENNPKFKGSLAFDEVQETIPKIKYTLCYPITKGDISVKWVEAVRAGIIPFFDVNYDTDKILNKMWNVPEFLYLSNPEEMKTKIEYLENNPDEYNKYIVFFEKLIDWFNKNYKNVLLNKIDEYMN